MVFQKPNPFPAMSIYDNVLSGLRFSRIRVRDADDLVEEMLTKAGLWNEVRNRLKSLGGELSGGQQQRLCIARALAVRPSVLLMDEPCSALDPTSTRRIEETIRDIAEEVTVVIVTHNMQQAHRVSQNCAFFLAGENEPGRLVEAGPTEMIFSNPPTRGPPTMSMDASDDDGGLTSRPQSRSTASPCSLLSSCSSASVVARRHRSPWPPPGIRERPDDHRRRIELRGGGHRPVGGRDQLDRRGQRQLLGVVLGHRAERVRAAAGRTSGPPRSDTAPARRTTRPPAGYAYQYLPDVAGATCMMFNLDRPHHEPADHLAAT